MSVEKDGTVPGWQSGLVRLAVAAVLVVAMATAWVVWEITRPSMGVGVDIQNTCSETLSVSYTDLNSSKQTMEIPAHGTARALVWHGDDWKPAAHSPLALSLVTPADKSSFQLEPRILEEGRVLVIVGPRTSDVQVTKQE